jgi:hypothetical protein
MKKKLGLFALLLSLMLAACGGNVPEPEPEEDEDEISIELSDKKVEIEAGEEAEVEIENYDDLSKVKVKVEDEDIAECDIDDEIITITGISEGKTKVIVSAKGAEDVSITVKVTEPELPVVVTPAVLFPETPTYVYRLVMDENIWFNMLDKEVGYEDLAAFFGDLELGLDFYIEFTATSDNSGDAIMYFDASGFGKELSDALTDDDNFRKFVAILMAAEGLDDYDDSMYDQIAYMKDGLIEELSTEIIDELDNSENMYDLTWAVDANILTLMMDYEIHSVPINELDGSFTLSIPSYDLPNDPIFSDGLDMVFYPQY